MTAANSAMFLDEAECLRQSKFPIKPDDLIKRAKDIIAKGDFVGADENDLSSDFTFAGPVVGPLPKQEYLGALRSFNLKKAFPDMNPQFHHFRVDPFETNRVWYTSAGHATFTGELAAFGGTKGNGQEVHMAHQTNSLVFNDQGQIKHYTIGYVMDKQLGNTGGLGGIYGILYAIGKPLPFPEAKPWKMSWRYWFFLKLQGLLSKFSSNKQIDNKQK